MARAGRKHECASTSNSKPITRKRETSMSSKTKRNESIGSQATSTTTAGTQDALARNSAREEEIKLRAYEIYLERGEQPGRELDDWLQAERELEGGALSRAGGLGSGSATSVHKGRRVTYGHRATPSAADRRIDHRRTRHTKVVRLVR